MRAAITALVIFGIAAFAAAETFDGYIAGLERIDAALRGGRIDAAHDEASRLLDAQIESPNGPFHADAALLRTIINAKAADLRLVTRLQATIGSLRRVSPSAARGTNPKLLAAIEREQEVAKPSPDGKALPLDEMTTNAMLRLGEAMGRALNWIGDRLTEFFEWLERFWPKSKEKEGARGNIRGVVIGIAVVIVILIAALAYSVLRRSRANRDRVVESTVPAASARDEDPLSRGANEWERYAAQLAAAGRMREAIRAWYHAVLVTLYSASVLHFRKGRTNWEYVSMLSPSLPWRGEFVELTRNFEVEWYGLHESGDEALEECRATARRITESVRRATRGAA